MLKIQPKDRPADFYADKGWPKAIFNRYSKTLISPKGQIQSEA